MGERHGETARVLVDRLTAAVNARDVDALVSCFAPDYRNETPAHPGRGFRGTAQVRRNWERIYAAVPDLTARLLRSAVSDDEVWTEWEHTGTRHDGAPHHMRGVVIFGLAAGRFSRARFYLEPVDDAAGDADAALATILGATS
ncbi:nuclear transport factor 2 family protein [Georgenia muralis]